ncbi:hypothetical protein OOZ63_25805 [Paucibacter sp. PLA-PC-4]|uniref:hypothetical protein n=1 Tax=Paucibacter sp. PLA-PC-4 TaxID=2993655 RepID=UPI00224B548F|nr:hypothetical protein [Paucibacter sp. PLA-PC-4]MCX2865247.1 hypothetical protein [Paucibacter sp. PLA-PC-4]
MMNVHRAKPLFLMGVLALGGCATPIVTWQRAPEGKDPGESMPAALATLERGRTAYRGAVEEQMRTEAVLGNGLVVAGAAVAALAVGKAHRDAIFGTSLVAGTGYALGNKNLPRSRVLVLLAGIDALDCAERAVLPLAISDREWTALVKAIQEVQDRKETLVAAMDTLRKKMAAVPASASTYTAALEAATKAKESAELAAGTASQFTDLAGRAARELVAAVNRIDTAVIKGHVESTGTLAGTPGIVSGLAGMAGAFAPGSNVEGLITDSLKAAGGIGAKSATGAVDQELADLEAATKATATATATLSRLMRGRATSWAEDAFKDCGVAQVSSALSTTATSLNFLANAESLRTFDIAGGVKPYFVQWDGPVVEGLELRAPIRFDSRVEIRATGSKLKQAAETALRISDSSPTVRVASVAVSVAAAGGSGGGGGPLTPAATQAASDSIDDALRALKEKTKFTVDGKTFDITAIPIKVDAKTLKVTLRCPADASNVDRAALAKGLLKDIGIPSEPAARGWDLAFEASATTCLKPA